MQELADKEANEHDTAQDAQNATIDELQKRLDNLLNLATKGVITAEEHAGRKTEISSQLKNSKTNKLILINW